MYNKHKLLLVLLAFYCLPLSAQIDPVKIYGDLFHDVQMDTIFEDSKTFPDCIPVKPPKEIFAAYENEKRETHFNLKTFVLQNFLLPVQYDASYVTDTSHSIVRHIEELWQVLSRNPDTVKNTSLIPLPYPYIVPGGRFREIYYWDSYFTMLGLTENEFAGIAESMVANFAYLIDTYGFVPNGNRTYYLSRSQPPFFSLMVSLLAEKRDSRYLSKYLPQLIKEYQFWMNGEDQLKSNSSYKRVVRLPGGEVLNRYYDDLTEPRPESYREDVLLAQSANRPEEEIYRNIRAACESGWDFSSRWLAEPDKLETIRTTEILPVDLNALIYFLEATIAKAYETSNDGENSKLYYLKAAKRKKAILKYFYNKEKKFFTDYDLVTKKPLNNLTLAGMYPIFFGIWTPQLKNSLGTILTSHFLKDGGVVTTTVQSGQQWDAPNGWPPLQYITIKALENTGYQELAKKVKNSWIYTNERVFTQTGKIMEKYNVVDPEVEAGGGEYPSQDGFGWTNGVYIKLARDSKDNNSVTK